MGKALVIIILIGLGLGFMLPAGDPPTAAAAAKATKAELFEAPDYQETELERRADGHFYVTAEVNGSPVTFLVDTGATSVALTQEDARSVGIEFSAEEFQPIARTANGLAKGKLVTLDKVAIEGKEVTEVDAAIMEKGDVSLLGQAYLARISGIEMNGDTMVLR